MKGAVRSLNFIAISVLTYWRATLGNGDSTFCGNPGRRMTLFAFVLHIAGGAVALLAGLTAVCARKGGALHRKAGTLFVLSMLVMAVFALYLAVVMPGQLVNVLISIFALYFVGTAWLAVRRKEGGVGLPEKIALAVSVCLSVPFVVLASQLAVGATPMFTSAVPLKGPVLIAIDGFTTVLVLAALGDARLVIAGGIAGVARISRHLWRMCLGLTLALGSGFTNGFARLLPGPYHVPTAFFLPQFIPILLLIFWLIRLRLPGYGAARQTTKVIG